jgi:hypothetical protein
MEGQASWSTLGILNSIQDTYWDVSISVGIREDLSFTSGARIQGSLGY